MPNEIIKRYVQLTGARLYRDNIKAVWIVTTPSTTSEYNTLDEMVQSMVREIALINDKENTNDCDNR